MSTRRKPEEDFSISVREYAEAKGWRCFYVRQSGYVGRDGKWRGTVPAGWPDAFFVRGPRALAWELKTPRGRATQPQLDWLLALGQVTGIKTALLRPEDWPRIRELLE